MQCIDAAYRYRCRPSFLGEEGTTESCAKTAEPIKITVETETRVDPRNHVSYGRSEIPVPRVAKGHF